MAILLNGHCDSEGRYLCCGLRVAGLPPPLCLKIVMLSFLSQKMDMTPEIDEHKVIHEGLEQFIAFIAVARGNAAMFDAANMTAIINAIRDPLVPISVYIRAQCSTRIWMKIARLDPDNTKVSESKAVDEMTTALVKFAVSHDNPFLSIPFALT